MTWTRVRDAATTGRGAVSIGAAVLVVASLMQWWQVGGGVGELPQRAGPGIADGRVLLVFLAATACLLLVALRFAAGARVAIDHPLTLSGLLAVGVAGYSLMALDLAGRALIPLPPARGPGFWVAAAGLGLLAMGVARVFRERGPAGEAADSVPPVAVEPDPAPADEPERSDEPEAVMDAEPPDRPQYVPGWMIRAWGRLAGPSDAPDRSGSLDSEPRGRLDRMDAWVVVALIVAVLFMRV